MLQSLHVQGLGPVPELKAEFGSRLNILTGDNGLGKSFLLDIVYWVLADVWPGGRMARPGPVVPNGQKPSLAYSLDGGAYRPPSTSANWSPGQQAWNRWDERPHDVGIVLHIGADGKWCVLDPCRNFTRIIPAGAYERMGGGAGDGSGPRATFAPASFELTPQSLERGFGRDGRLLCNGLIRDWTAWYHRHGSAPNGPLPIELLEGVVQRLSHPDEPMRLARPQRVSADDVLEYPALELPYGIVPYPQLSAGMKRVIDLAYLLIWTWTEHVLAATLRGVAPTTRIVMVVEEIELHLHPKWQRTVLPALLAAVEGLIPSAQVQILASTHSPLVLASLEADFDPQRDKLFTFSLEGGRVEFAESPWTPHGDMVGWLTSDIFDLKQARSREAERAIEAAEALMRGDMTYLPAGLQTRAEIDGVLRKLLPGLDPFWPRWIVGSKA